MTHAFRRMLPAAVSMLLGAAAAAHPKPGAHADVRFAIDRHAVTGEFLMNLRFAEQLVLWPRDARDDVGPAEEAAGRDAFIEYLGGPPRGRVRRVLDRANRVVIDGVEVAPVLTEFRIIRPAAETRPGFVDVAQAMLPQVLVRVEYPCKSRPRSVSLVWGAYPRDFLAPDRDVAPISDIDALVLAEGEPVPVKFRDREPEFMWHAPDLTPEERFRPAPSAAPRVDRSLAGPTAVLAGILGGFAFVAARGTGRRSFAVAGVVLAGASAGFLWLGRGSAAGAPLPTPVEAVVIFETLHANIYRAFDYARDSDIYDALARSVDGPLLPVVYDEVYRSLIMQEEGGALSRVKSVEPVATTAEAIVGGRDSASFGITARWRVEGVVYHWGHSHSRLVEHAARFRLESKPAGWRVVAVEPLEQRRLEPPAVSLR